MKMVNMLLGGVFAAIASLNYISDVDWEFSAFAAIIQLQVAALNS